MLSRNWKIVTLYTAEVGVAYCNSPETTNKSDISYLKTSRAFDILIHSGKPNSVG